MSKVGSVLILFILFLIPFAGGHDFQLAPRLPNGLSIDPAGRTFDVGNMPLAGVVSPEGRFVLLLSGFREQGVQVVDPASESIVQTLPQPSAFLGLAFSSDGSTLYASGSETNAIYVYGWKDGVAEPKGKLELGQATLPEPHSRFPAGIALSKDNRYLYVAENQSDTLAVVDLVSGVVTDRKPAGRYPYAVAVAPDGAVYVSAWGDNTISQFKMEASGATVRETRSLAVGRHLSALLLNPKGTRLFATSASTDSIGIVDTTNFRLLRILKDPAPGAQEGSTPNALALSADGSRLYVAEADSNAVAVFQLSASSSGLPKGPARDRLAGRIPVGWYPTAFLNSGDRLFVINGKGRGTRANPGASQGGANIKTPNDYTLGQLNGTITELPANVSDQQLASYSNRVAELNNWNSKPEQDAHPPFKHVVYIIKENRTYDQVFGDLPEGDGDPTLVFFPAAASPNHRALAERFGLFDRFFVNAEVSNQGHPWSTSAYVTDYREKLVYSEYSDRREGEPAEDDVGDPAAGYLWDLATRGHVSIRVYGEYAELGPDKKTYRAQKKGAAACTSPTYPSYNLSIPDQTRVDAWIQEFNDYVKQGRMPALEILHLPNDHTGGARAKMKTPAAYFADNDLALGRLVETLSNSPFWKDTIVFVVEDDSQSGPDHVDSHRSVLLVISAYNKPGVSHLFVNTTDVLATIEKILGLGSLSQFDTHGRPLRDIFAKQPDLSPYHAITPQQSLAEMNPDNENAKSSRKLKLEKEDLSDDDTFNRILWAAIKGDGIPYPEESRVTLLQLEREK